MNMNLANFDLMPMIQGKAMDLSQLRQPGQFMQAPMNGPGGPMQNPLSGPAGNMGGQLPMNGPMLQGMQQAPQKPTELPPWLRV
jgi:hypothetical protein